MLHHDGTSGFLDLSSHFARVPRDGAEEFECAFNVEQAADGRQALHGLLPFLHTSLGVEEELHSSVANIIANKVIFTAQLALNNFAESETQLLEVLTGCSSHRITDVSTCLAQFFKHRKANGDYDEALSLPLSHLLKVFLEELKHTI